MSRRHIWQCHGLKSLASNPRRAPWAFLSSDTVGEQKLQALMNNKTQGVSTDVLAVCQLEHQCYYNCVKIRCRFPAKRGCHVPKASVSRPGGDTRTAEWSCRVAFDVAARFSTACSASVLLILVLWLLVFV